MTKNTMTPLKDLNLMDRFLFDEVMEDTEAYQAALGIIFGKEISLLPRSESEKEIRNSPFLRSVRMDIYGMDTEETIYNTEMQKTWKNDLAKRSRYYQSLLDSKLLDTGIPSYNQLNDTYQIIITPFDLFGLGRYVYTFRAACEEVSDLFLEDGAVRIFLNTRGQDPEAISPELREFLHYLEHTTDETAAYSSNPALQCIHRRVQKIKANEEMGVRYMQAWEERYYELEEARNEGKNEGWTLGHQDGVKDGRARERFNILQRAKEKGLSNEQLIEILGATPEELGKL